MNTDNHTPFPLNDQLIPGRVSKKNPCPVCNHNDGCRVLNYGVLCLRSDRLNIPLGWEHRKDLRSGMGSLVVPKSNHQVNSDDREKLYQK
ncbi:MAG: hypothetical protein ACRDB1_07005, partial [Microcoleaceae cyanobacterium]